ncbi:hypothetical protein ACWA3Y_24165 [Escherichia coli]|uniref:hypothetical protein n=1 Tax=Escherichia coli TaxID=562 RepID=UPI00334E2D21
MVYNISDNQKKLIWKFYKNDENKWIWYCYEKSGYLLSQSDTAFNSQLSCIENAKKYGYSEKSILPLFLHISYVRGKGWIWYQCYDCGYIVKQTSVFFPTYQECINDVKKREL